MGKYCVANFFYTPPGYSGISQLDAGNGLSIIEQGQWRYSQAGYNDGATFGLSIGGPGKPGDSPFYGGTGPIPGPEISGGELHLRAQNWPISVIGNTLSQYVDPVYGTLPASKCRILVTGAWTVLRRQNSNSFNSIGVLYRGDTKTDLGDRIMAYPNLLSYTTPEASYVIQGAEVSGGAQNTFSDHVFFVKITELVNSDNSNREFQSNTVVRPVWVYSYRKSWEIDI